MEIKGKISKLLYKILIALDKHRIEYLWNNWNNQSNNNSLKFLVYFIKKYIKSENKEIFIKIHLKVKKVHLFNK